MLTRNEFIAIRHSLSHCSFGADIREFQPECPHCGVGKIVEVLRVNRVEDVLKELESFTDKEDKG